MRRPALFAALLLLAAVGAGATSPAPQLRITDTSPLTVRGSGFKPSEHVRVTYAAARTWTVRTSASPAGTFSARFASQRLDVCSARYLRAAGSLGSRAAVKFPPVECPQPVDEP